MIVSMPTTENPVTIIHADCMDVLPHIPKSVTIITDPPYEIVMSGGGIGAKRQYTKDCIGFTDCGFDYSILDRFDNWACFGTLKQVPKLIERAGGRRWMLITWNKPNPTPLCGGNYLPDTEYIVHAWSKGGLHGGYHDKARFIVHPSGDVRDGTHPNEKPICVMAKIIRSASPESGLVVDPYAGSGSTAIACIEEGRRCIVIEKDAKYVQIIRQRVDQALCRDKGNLFHKPHQAELFSGDAA